MVCSSTLRAKPVTHSTKRCWPRWVKPKAIGNRMACQSDHSGVAFIAHLLEGWFVGGHNRQAPSRRCACQSTRMQDNGERHCQTLDFTRNYWIAEFAHRDTEVLEQHLLPHERRDHGRGVLGLPLSHEPGH